MAKFKRYDSRNKKASFKKSRSGQRVVAHMENKYFKQQKTQEIEQFLADDVDDYLEDHYL